MSVDAKAKQPNTLRWKYVGINENNISNDVLLDKRGDGILLITWVAIKMQSPQKESGKCDWKCKALATLSKCWCFLSTVEFCCGVST